MCTMVSKAFIWPMIFTLMFLSTCCKGQALNSKDESTMIEITNATTNTKNNEATKSSLKALVLCKCNSGEVMDDTGQCQHWAGGTSVTVESRVLVQESVNTQEFNVTVLEPQCQYQQVDLQNGEFVLRDRGDLLVMKGTYRGLRLSDYCVHRQLSAGKIKVTAQGCVSVPEVPRCCAEGRHVLDGSCVPNTMNLKPFDPSIATGPLGDKGLAGAPFTLVDQQEYVSMPNCSTGFIMKKVKLDWKNSYIFALPQNVLLTFSLDDDKREYISPSQYCVEAPEEDDTYFAFYCKNDVEAFCENKSCVNKCCPEGQSLSIASRGCVPSNASFKSLLSSSSSKTVVYGYPTCAPITQVSKFNLSPDDTLITEHKTYAFDRFCIDNFIKELSIEPGALICFETAKETLWHNVRRELFPICAGISCAFLVLLLLLNAWIPKLIEKEDRNLLFHAASLLLAFSITLSKMILVPRGYIVGDTCLALAFVMQFAYLSSFFWLNTMCFDMWRLSRNLVVNNCSPVSPLAVWKYMLYAVGGPLTITLTTIIIQFAAPLDGSIPGLIHPRIGEGRCWFRSSKELVAYFYGPIAVLFLLNFILIGIAYYYLRIIRGDYKSADTPRKTNFFAEYWQRFYLLVLVALCWFTEILSFLIPPEELWAATDILNSLQGMLVFLVFISPSSKRALIKENILKLFNVCLNYHTELKHLRDPGAWLPKRSTNS